MSDQVMFSGAVDVDEHLLMLLPEDDPEPEASFDAVLVDLAGRSGLYVHTGCAMGPVHVTVLLNGDPPADLDDTWEAQELVSIDLRGPLFVTWLGDDGTLGGPHLRPERPGPHRVRVSVRGDRSLHYDLVVDEPNEEYLVELWPDTVLRERETTRRDGVGDPIPEPEPAASGGRGVVHVVDSHYVPPPDGLRLLDESTLMAGLTEAEANHVNVEADEAYRLFTRLLPMRSPGLGWAWRDLPTDDWHVWHTEPERLDELLAPIRAAHPSVRWVVHRADFDYASAEQLAEERSLNGIPGLMFASLRNDGSGLAMSMKPDFPEEDLPGLAERVAVLDLPMPTWIEIYRFPDEPEPRDGPPRSSPGLEVEHVEEIFSRSRSLGWDETWVDDETGPFDGR